MYKHIVKFVKQINVWYVMYEHIVKYVKQIKGNICNVRTHCKICEANQYLIYVMYEHIVKYVKQINV